MRAFSILLLMLTACSETATWKLRETNDYFTALNNDHAYTQGLELSRQQGRDTIALGQDIYTPRSKREYIPPKTERPYGGYLYASWSRRFDSYTAAIKPGWVGPGALGKEAQCGVHRILGQYCPYGWATQISNRPTLQGTVEKEWNYGTLSNAAGINAGTPTSSLFFTTRQEWLLWLHGKLDVGSRLEVFAHDSLLDAAQSTVHKRPYRATVLLGLRWKGVRYFLATETSAIKETGEAYNYGGLEFTW